jgi:predicted ATPase/DNA-binding SARP family transcriptional activator
VYIPVNQKLQIGLLGQFVVTCAGVPITTFESNKVRALLAYLVAEHQRAHERSALTGLLWPDWPEASARRSLSQALFNLRQAIQDHAADPPYLLVSRQTIQWNRGAAVAVDLHGCEAALVDAKALDRNALAQLSRLYRAPLLDQFVLDDSEPFQQWLLVRREGLQRQVLDSLERYADCLLGDGAPDQEQAQQVIEQQLRLEPWREAAHRQFMRLLALRGQRNAALAQFERCRQTLADELGVEPATETVALYIQIKEGATAITSPTTVTSVKSVTSVAPVTPAPILRPRFNNLPTPPTPLIGRSALLAEISDHLRKPACRLLTLLGPGGIGKTHLALAAAQAAQAERVDGVCFLTLADFERLPGAAGQDHLLRALAGALQLSFEGQAAPEAHVAAYLRDKALLLVLDNFEPLIDATPLLATLLAAAPQVQMLVTSRERLNLQEEWLLAVDSLTFPPPLPVAPVDTVALPVEEPAWATWGDRYSAVQLFVQCAQRVQPSFQLDEATAVAVARICQLVDGMPLGITLAAAWVRHLACTEIVREIEQTADFLATSLRNTPARHRSMRAVFDYSWRLLTATEQETLAQLAIFPQPFSREAAQAIAHCSLLTLSELIDKSLLRRTAEGRYELHPLLRQFAAERLQTVTDLAQTVQQRHADWFGAFLQRHLAGLSGAEQRTAVQQVEIELENLRSGWRYAVEKQRADLIDHYTPGLFHFYNLRGWYQEGAQLFMLAIEQLRQAHKHADDERALGALLIHQAEFDHRLGRFAAAQALLAEAMPLIQQHNRPGEVGFAFNALGFNAYMRGAYAEARPHYTVALTHFRAINQAAGIETVLNNLGNVAAALDPNPTYTEAHALYSESIALARATGNFQELARGLLNLGTIAHVNKAYAEARYYYEESIRAAELIRSRRVHAIGLTNLGDILLQLGELPAARQALEAALALKQTMGDQRSMIYTLNVLASIHYKLEELPQARERYIQAVRIGTAIQAWPPVLDALLELARIAIAVKRQPWAVQLAGLVLHHSATEAHTRRAAQSLLADLAVTFTAEEANVLQAKAQFHDLNALVAAAFGA